MREGPPTLTYRLMPAANGNRRRATKVISALLGIVSGILVGAMWAYAWKAYHAPKKPTVIHLRGTLR